LLVKKEKGKGLSSLWYRKACSHIQRDLNYY